MAQSLEQKLENALKRIESLEAVHEIEKIQYKYGYYLDKCLYQQGLQCFSESPDVQVNFHNGIYRGHQGLKRLYVERFQKNFTAGRNGPVTGFLLDHIIGQPVIDVSEDGKTAKARFRIHMQAGLHVSALHTEGRDSKERQWYEGALYENHYRKDSDGSWKILWLNYKPVWHCDMEKGVSYTEPEYVPFFREADLYPKTETGPDELVKGYDLWPDTNVFPFHYPSPNGTWLTEEERVAQKKVYK